MTAVGQRKAAAIRRSGREARRKIRAAAQSPPFRVLVRVGFLARAITYAVIGLLALSLALGAGTMGANASPQGALALIARGWLGILALVVIAAGLLAYATWKLTQAAFGRGPEGGGGPSVKDRLANLAGGAAYIVFFSVAVRALESSGKSSGGRPSHEAAGILGWPGGPVLVGLAGAVLVAVSIYQAYDGVVGRFAREVKTEQLGPTERSVFMHMGRVGLCARALVFVLVGYFLIRTAADYSARTAVGVDGALSRLHQQALGPWLVGLVGVGLLAFAAFSWFEARVRRL